MKNWPLLFVPAVWGMSLAFTLAARQQESAPTPRATTTPSSEQVSVKQDVPYASINGTELHLDVYEPAAHPNAAAPGVILIHGGGWTEFDKSTMRGMGEFLARSGFVAFSVDYRLFHGNENRWPAQLDDVQRSVRWVRANAAKYDVDPDHIGAFGHSAGAQLAALLGMEDTRDNSDPALAKYSSRVQAVVDVSGPTDFTTEHDPEGQAFLAQFFGEPYSQDPKVWQNASPVFHVSQADAPFLIVHGTQDQNVPIAEAQELYDKLKAAGAQPEFVKVEGGHTFTTPEARRELAFASLSFFDHYLTAKKP
jgi:acetyl esterase/lipase